MSELKWTWALLFLAATIFTATKAITVDTLWICLFIVVLGLQMAVKASKHDET